MTNRTIIDEAVIYVVTVGEQGPAGPAGGGGGPGGPVNATDVIVVPSGNLSSVDAQSALVELQTDIDGRALTGHNHTGVYQPLDGDLTSIAGQTGTGFLKRAGVDSWTIDSNAYALASHNHTGVYQPLDADLTAIAALAGASGFLTKTALDTWALDTNSYSLASHNHAGVYQPLDADLTAIAALGFSATAFLKKTALDTWTLDTTAYAPLASPTFTGVPAGPTATVDTNTTQLATTAFVIGQGYLKSTTAASTYQPLDGDLTSIAGIAGTSGLLSKIGVNSWVLDTNSYALASHNHAGVYEPAYTTGGLDQAWRGDKTWQDIPTILGYTPVNLAGDSGLGTMVFGAFADIYKSGTAAQFYVGSTSSPLNGAALVLSGGTHPTEPGEWALYAGLGGGAQVMRGSPAGWLNYGGVQLAFGSLGLNADALGYGSVPMDRIGSIGTRDDTHFLRGDGLWTNTIRAPIYFGFPGAFASNINDNGVDFAGEYIYIRVQDTTGGMFLEGGSNSALLWLASRNHANAGGFELRANDGFSSAALYGTAAGALQWGGMNFTIGGDFFLGGSINSTINTQMAVLSSGVGISAEQLIGMNTGAKAWFYGGSYAGTPGWFIIQADNTSVATALMGTPTGALSWNTVQFANSTGLMAGALASGTIPDARFPATLPAVSGVNLTNLNASNLASGTVPDARFPATLPAISGANLTNLNASNLASGTVPTARLGSGTANSSAFLRGDSTWTNTLAGNMGIAGVSPFAWGSVIPYALQVRNSAVASGSDNVNTYLISNLYHNGTNWVYATTERAGVLVIAPGTGGVSYNFYTTPSGTGGTAATLSVLASLSPAGDFWSATISPGGLANWYLGQSSSNPHINLDSNDYISFNRTINRLSVVLGGTTYFYVDDNDIVYCANGVDGGNGPISTLGSAGMTAPKFTSTVATGTQPYACTSTTLNTNLNSDLCDGLHVHTGRNNGVNQIVRTNSSGYLDVGYINTNNGTESSTATSYVYIASSDGYFRHKALADVKTEIVTSTAVNTAIGGLATVNFKQNANLVSDVGGAGTLYSSSIAGSTTAAAANMVIDATGYYMQRSTSSARYKRNIQNATHGLAEVLQLRPVTYQGKGRLDGDKVHGGLIAEEVHALGLTEFVSYHGDLPDGLSYGPMVSLLAKALQEEHAITQALEARVALLEAA